MPTIDMATRARSALRRTVALLVMALLFSFTLPSVPATAKELSRAARIDARTPGRHLPLPRRVLRPWELTRRHHDYPAWDGMAKKGTPIFAMRGGRVIMVTSSGACGKGVMIQGVDGFTYLYCHGNKVLVGKGRRVKAGRRIMRSGSTGSATAPHLHLQIQSASGQLRCPQRLLKAEWRGRRIPTGKAPSGGCSY